MNNLIGMMQGRLSYPAPPGVISTPKLQVFPYQAWEQEFENARACGFDLIEWLFTEKSDVRGDLYPNSGENPLMTESGRHRIQFLIKESGVQVQTCCAHYFMLHPFIRVSEAERLSSIAMLSALIENSARVGIKTILLPVLETCEIRDEGEKLSLLQSLGEPLDLAQKLGVRLALEMELPGEVYRAFLERANHPALGAYYDSGNNTARGYDIVFAVHELGNYLFGVHIKDRVSRGSSVLLGQGDTDFSGFFPALQAAGYTGPIILETPLGSDPLLTARNHAAFVRRFLS
jgi:L-ribulose-5-phosphate 3-epimerase